MEGIKENLREWIAELEKRCGSRRKLAKAVGVNDSTISKWVNNGETLPTIENLASIADFLGMSLSEVMAVLEKPKSKPKQKELPLSFDKILAEIRGRNAEELVEIIYTASVSVKIRQHKKPSKKRGASMETLGELIKHEMRERGMSIEDLAEDSMYDIELLKQIINEKVFPCAMQPTVIQVLTWFAGWLTNPLRPAGEEFADWQELATYCGIDINNLPQHNSHGSITNGV